MQIRTECPEKPQHISDIAKPFACYALLPSQTLPWLCHLFSLSFCWLPSGRHVQISSYHLPAFMHHAQHTKLCIAHPCLSCKRILDPPASGLVPLLTNHLNAKVCVVIVHMRCREFTGQLIAISSYVAYNEAHNVRASVLMIWRTVEHPLEVENQFLISHREHLELKFKVPNDSIVILLESDVCTSVRLVLLTCGQSLCSQNVLPTFVEYKSTQNTKQCQNTQ